VVASIDNVRVFDGGLERVAALLAHVERGVHAAD
jgi:hypothetical protein